ncbi:hypothetical protein [uncultured Cohaesibacter sp.]|uniref:phosphotransferase-like protein n=1 Tax=uncultured Cohaesibacter sp. TaxID=1002546 RepID=UPI0029C825C2|nr:hypothetical protein [uncultured Cohaesibacter sp.]
MTTDTAQILFLHGASSSGKSTLARALQDALPVPFWHISIDHLRDSGVLPSHRFKSGEFDWKAARPRFFDGYHQSPRGLCAGRQSSHSGAYSRR